MRRPVVILRTVSVEKMSPVLEACAARWASSPIWVVSNAGRADEMRNDKRVTEVIVIQTGDFSSPVSVDTLAEAVVVPVANEGGSGYGNVLAVSLAISAKSFFICSRCRVLFELGRGGFASKARLERFWGWGARLFAGFWADRILDS